MNFFENKIKDIYPFDIANKIINGSSFKRKTTLRINTLKANITDVTNELTANGVTYKGVPYSDTSLIIESSKDKLCDLNLYKDGKIYLQSLSSQLPPIILKPCENEDILDMCAAPGGKLTQIAAITNNKCNLTACEMNNMRAERMKYNIEKLGVNCANIMVIDSRNLENFFSFDKILLDAPCSGSGTFNLNNENSYNGFSPALINKCVAAQTKLLTKALSVLKVGGEMVYSTCSVLPEENDQIIKNVLSKFKCQILPIDNSILTNLPLLPCSIENGVCVCPTDEYEGFFIVKIKKIDK